VHTVTAVLNPTWQAPLASRAEDERKETQTMPTQAEQDLRKAAMEGDLATLTRLVAEGVNVNATHEYGKTALMEAAWCGKLDCLDHLIAKGANLNAQNNASRHDKWTALHYAAINGRAPCVKSLLKAGADASLKDDEGDTALDRAKRMKHTEVIKILENPAAYLAAQVGRAAPHPPPRRTAPAPCATDACSRIPGCSLTALSRPITSPQ
jgi:hypothetical protein